MTVLAGDRLERTVRSRPSGGPLLLVALAVLALALLGCRAAPLSVSANASQTLRDTADRLIFWVNCDDVVELTGADLDAWTRRGVDGFVCMVGYLRGMGGRQEFAGDPDVELRSGKYSLQRSLRNSGIAKRAARRDMKMYLGAYLANHHNRATPLREWFDDRAWSRLVLRKLSGLAGAAKLLGFAGVAFDQELYPQAGGTRTASWSWNYRGNTHPEEVVRAKARDRGSQLMRGIVRAFPGVELMAYDVRFPRTWPELVQDVVNGNERAFADRLDVDFWDGLSSVKGYRAIRFVDPTFYKTPHLGSWDTALQYHYNSVASLLSRRFSNWKYASSRVFISPFSWIDSGPSESAFDDARPPSYVQEQLLAFRRWGMGREFPNYAYSGLGGFDYSTYAGAMQAASSPAKVDPLAPTLAISSPRRGRRGAITGMATDNLAIWAVRWQDDRGRSGTADLDWEVESGDYGSRYVWEMRWSFPASSLSRGATRVSVTAEDIKGNTTTRRAKVRGPGGP